MINREDLIVQATYNKAIFGDWDCMVPDEPNAYVIDCITREHSPQEVRQALTRGDHMPTGHCRGGYIWHYDTDYSCSGCANCRAKDAQIGWVISAFVWDIATRTERARLARTIVAFEALAAIGRAITAALSPGWGVASFAIGMIKDWHQVRVGRYYEVVGKRGFAKAAHGKVGEVSWLGETTYGSSHTLQAGLKVEGHEKLIYVPASTLAPIVPPAEVVTKRAIAKAATADRKLRDSVRAPFPATYVAPGRKAKHFVAGIVISGPHAGKRGRVFWMAAQTAQKDGLRVGVDIGESEPAWCDARNVVPEPASHVVPHEHAAADGSVVNTEEVIEQYVLALAEIGCDADAEGWARKMKMAR